LAGNEISHGKENFIITMNFNWNSVSEGFIQIEVNRHDKIVKVASKNCDKLIAYTSVVMVSSNIKTVNVTVTVGLMISESQ
jgi:hypothetical protein